jgi:hypothetical protein
VGAASGAVNAPGENRMFFGRTVFALALVTAAVAASEEIPLNGAWEFAYTAKPGRAEVVEKFTVAVMIPPNPQVPEEDQFALSLQVPGYWDEQLPYLPDAPWGAKVNYYGGTGCTPIRFPFTGPGRPRHPDAGRPFIVGTGWYRKTVDVPEEWRGRTVVLRVGGARIDSHCFVNGLYNGMHHGHDTPFEFDLTDQLAYGRPNELLLAVDNNVPYINSCALRGYQGLSGGIYGDVSLHVSGGPGRIASWHVYPVEDLSRLVWRADLSAPAGVREATRLVWSVDGPDGARIQSGETRVRPLAPGEVFPADWECPAAGIAPWSVWNPVLNRVDLRWERADGKEVDADGRTFGMRRLLSRNGCLFLNGRPIQLRGVCEMYHFAPEVHPPNDGDYFRERLLRLKEAGFNYVRFHTWVPMVPYLRAADEVGMLLGPEHSLSPDRNPLDDARWGEMIRGCRAHPSAVTYCGGNEETGHEGLIAKFAERFQEARTLAPDALVIPMHTMSGPEDAGGHADLPVPAHLADMEDYYDRLWARVTRFSDLFAIRANDFSYSNFTGRDWRAVEPEYTRHRLPLLAHESGILGTYINLALEERLAGKPQRDLYSAAREHITAAGRLDMAPVYYENSARWHGQARKFVTENLRKCGVFDGYDLLGGWDSHWHNAGYGCGLFNEFFELKPGDTLERVLQYNGESVVLLDNAKRHVFRAGERAEFPVMASLYGGADLADGLLAWRVLDGDAVLLSGELTGLDAPDGAVTTVATVAFDWPLLKEARRLVLSVTLSGSGYALSNQWDFWVFPERPAPAFRAFADPVVRALLADRFPGLSETAPVPGAGVRVVAEMAGADLEHLEAGGDVLLLGAKPFPANDTAYVMGVAGRAHMNLATVVRDHPALKYLPHDGWCDWQFQRLLDGGTCVEFSRIPAPFDPIVEVVSSYKYIRLQSALWEARAGRGRLFVVGFHMDPADPAALALLDGVVEHITGDGFQPATTLSVGEVLKPVLAGTPFQSLKGNDGNYYAGPSLY